MKSLIVSFVTVFILSAGIATATPVTTHPATKPVTLSGYLVDKMCAPKMVKDASTAYEKAGKHDKECLTENGCFQSGFGVVTSDGKWYPFDKKGSLQAAKIAKGTTTNDHIMVNVTGRMKKGQLVVSSLAEAQK